MPEFILASASPRRKEILEAIGISPKIAPSDIDEGMCEGDPVNMVMQLALLKGAKAAETAKRGQYVISADTVVVLDGKVLGKPKNDEEAFRMLMELSGRTHEVITGYSVMKHNGEASVRYELTRVTFRQIEEDEAQSYIKTGEPRDKAGAYGIQGMGRLFVEKIDGDYYNVVGLPVCALLKMLKNDFGVNLL